MKISGFNTWTNVPKRDADGSVIAYTAYENEIPDAYVQYEERDSERYADIGLKWNRPQRIL